MGVGDTSNFNKNVNDSNSEENTESKKANMQKSNDSFPRESSPIPKVKGKRGRKKKEEILRVDDEDSFTPIPHREKYNKEEPHAEIESLLGSDVESASEKSKHNREEKKNAGTLKDSEEQELFTNNDETNEMLETREHEVHDDSKNPPLKLKFS